MYLYMYIYMCVCEAECGWYSIYLYLLIYKDGCSCKGGEWNCFLSDFIDKLFACLQVSIYIYVSVYIREYGYLCIIQYYHNTT